MTEPEFKVTAESVLHYAKMFDIPLAEAEAAALAAQLAGGFGGIAELWQVDVGGFEPSVTFPVERR